MSVRAGGFATTPDDIPESTARLPGTEMWSRIVDDPKFEDLPFRVETNGYGQLVLSPRIVRQSDQRTRIFELLCDRSGERLGGRVLLGLAVETSDGVKVPDVVWISAERWAVVLDDADFSPVLPEIMVEVAARDAATAELEERRRLYLGCGALEFWICDADGQMHFYGPDGELAASEMVSSFPASIP